MEEAGDSAQPAEMLDYSSSVGAFLVRGPQGRMVAFTGFHLAPDMSQVAPKMSSADLSVVDTLVTGHAPSSLVLVLHPGDHAHAYFLMDTAIAGAKRSMKVFQTPSEIIFDALESGRFPAIDLDDLRRGFIQSRRNRAPLSVRVLNLNMRTDMPEEWRHGLLDLFSANMETGDGKTERLQQRAASLRLAVRSTMFRRYLSQCLWVDPAGSLIGRISPSRMNNDKEAYGFVPFLGGDAKMSDFVSSLAKDERERFIMREGIANVLPTPFTGRDWASPTLHIYDEPFRERYGFQEFYSLYRGLEALCELGAPVLVYSLTSIETSIPVALLRPVEGGGGLILASVRDFASRGVVWQR